MSTGVSDHQRNKGQGNSKPYNKFPNGPKDHHGAEQHEDVDSWRNQQQQQQQQHQGNAYMTGAGSADPYMQSYYGQSFQYANYGVNETGPWANNGGGDPFIGGGGGGGGYASGGMVESGGAPGGPYDNGMFGNGGGSYGNFGGGQPGHGFGYGGFHGNGGDYNTWGQPRKPYDDYYRDGYGDKMMERAMGGLSLGNEREESGGGGKSKSWANIASQPAKVPSMKKKAGMPHPPIIPGNWDNKNGSVPKAPMVAPVQAPHPPAWERQKPAPPQNGPPPQQDPPQNMGPGPGYLPGPPSGGPPVNRNQPYHQRGPPPSYNNAQQQQHTSASAVMPPPQANSHESTRPQPSLRSAEPATRIVDPPPKIKDPEDIKIKNNYNPAEFDLSPEGARFFVIKSYSEDDIHRSIKYEIWCSTERGNHTLDQAFREREGKGPVFLFFSVNGSGHFCGIAQMMSAVDYNASSSVWCQDKWKGQFKVKWVYVKDVANSALRQIRLENNENKPVTNSRDTQEVPYEKGKQVLKIIHTYAHTTSIFDDFIHYEERQKEEDQRRSTQQASPPIVQQDRPGYDRGGRGGHHHQPYNERGGSNQNYYQNSRGDRDFGFRGAPDREGQGRREMNDRGGPDREQFNRGYDRGDYQRDYRGGRGGGRGMPRN